MTDLICPFSATLVKDDSGCRRASWIIRHGGSEIACNSAHAQIKWSIARQTRYRNSPTEITNKNIPAKSSKLPQEPARAGEGFIEYKKGSSPNRVGRLPL